jgi:type IV pilus assembly protein PilP
LRRNPRKRKRRRQVKRNKKSNGLLILSILFFFFITGCSGGTSPPAVTQKVKPSPAAKQKTDPVKVAEKKEPEKKEELEYTYNPAGKADPFRPFIQLTTAKGVSKIPLTPLQKYDISSLKLVAIIAAPEGTVALVEDSAGKGYFLKKGTLVGKNDGKVMRILKDRVIIEETYQDIFGQTKTSEVSLILHRPEEGGES